MSMQWTTEQVLALAPDDSSAKAGRGLASERHWVSRGRKGAALWGECQGSGSKPYQVQIDLSESAFKCSCPSRKFPCKHGIGLMLMLAGAAQAMPEADPPPWVMEWLEKRQGRAEKKAETAKPDTEKAPEERVKAAFDQAKRAASREKKVAQGLADLDLWMRDLVRQGLASLASRPFKFWDEMAARMVDAQAPGVARMVREMGGVAASGDGWQERLLERLGLLHLLIEGYGRLATLPEAVQCDIRDAIGWNIRQEDILAQPGIADVWYVLGQRMSDDGQIRVQRAYLLGLGTGKFALILSFAPLNAPGAAAKVDAGLVPGAAFAGELVYFPGAVPMRALLKERQFVPMDFPAGLGYADFAAMLSAYADALTRNPRLDEFPALLRNVTPGRDGDLWYLTDADGRRLPLPGNITGGWHLLALSGGHPLPSLFGEWDGRYLLPLNVMTGDDSLAL